MDVKTYDDICAVLNDSGRPDLVRKFEENTLITEKDNVANFQCSGGLDRLKKWYGDWQMGLPPECREEISNIIFKAD